MKGTCFDGKYGYTDYKSRRRTVSIEVHTDGSVILRAPNRMTKKELDIFIDKHMSWIESKQQLMKERKEEKFLPMQRLLIC